MQHTAVNASATTDTEDLSQGDYYNNNVITIMESLLPETLLVMVI